MFTPKWKKEAKLLLKGAKKFVDYKRDLLTPERVAEIDSRRDDLKAAVKAGDREKVAEASKQLRAICESSLPFEKPLGWLEENVEVMFVAVVIALGLRAYYLQPFRIPTGSMQPTLNGIIGKEVPEDKWPALPIRLIQMATRGTSYIKVVLDHDEHLRLARTTNGTVVTDLRDTQFLHFFSRSELVFADGSKMQMPAPGNPMYETGLSKTLEKAAENNGFLPAGTILCEGTIDSGDLVLVDKFTYHFRRPKRGEVFVFDTVGIEGTKKSAGAKPGTIKEQEDATHYIKRLAAVPGDVLSIAPPYIHIDGKIAHEPGFEYVYKLPLYHQPGLTGYSFANPHGSAYPPLLQNADDSIHLRKDAPVGMREYCALGDNSGNSLDSRYWGTVKEFNLVGPALFTLWPFTQGHWGFIH